MNEIKEVFGFKTWVFTCQIILCIILLFILYCDVYRTINQHNYIYVIFILPQYFFLYVFLYPF
jgi:glucan phosphoethanolaminetransferase (alkaline phosphatase superfamily)